MIGTKFYKKNLDNKAYFDGAQWCNANGAMIVDQGDHYEIVAIPEPPLNELKAKKIAALKAARDAAEIAPIDWSGNIYDYAANARDRMKIKRQALEDNDPTATVIWTTADNSFAEIGLADFIAINTLAAERGERLHIKYNELKMQVLAAETAEEVAAVIW